MGYILAAVVAGVILWVGGLVWAVRQIGSAIENAYRVGSEAAVRSVFGVLPTGGPVEAEDGKGSVASSDSYEDHPFAQEQVVSPAERERMLARLAPWDHEEGNPFE